MQKSFRATSIAIITLISGITISCKNNSSTNPVAPAVTTGNYYPLSVGNAWTYSDYETDSTGTVVPGTSYTEIDSVVSNLTLSGRTAYAVLVNYNGQNVGMQYLSFSTNGDLLHFTDTSAGGVGAWYALIPFSETNVGTVETLYSIGENIISNNNVVDTTYLPDTNECIFAGVPPLTGPAGTFQTKEIIDSDLTENRYLPVTERFSSHLFYANNVGMVESVVYNAEIYNSGNSMITYNSHSILESFHVQ